MKPLKLMFTVIVLALVLAISSCTQVTGPTESSAANEARKTEKRNLETSVINMMVDNNRSSIPNPVDTTPTNNMQAFPDATSTTTDKLLDPGGTAYDFVSGDQIGYVLYKHDKTADDGVGVLYNYAALNNTTYFYTIEADGTIHQWADAAKTGGEYID